MSEFGGGSSEVSESTEVNETPPEETGGESSEATQEAATEEANESGGFDDAEDTEAPDSNEDTEDIDSEDDGDESQDVGFEDGEDVDNTDSQPDDAETYEDDNISDADEDQIGFDDSEETDEVDDSDIEDEDPEVDSDGNEADEDPDGSPDGDPDGDPEDDAVEDDLDADDEFDDEEDAGELENYSDDSIDGDPEDDTVEDDQDVDDDGDIQDEDPEVDPDSNEADEDPDGSPDGDPDGDPQDDTVEDDLDADEDFDDEEDAGELENYSDDSIDGDPEDDTVEDDQDVDDDGDIQDEEPEADPDGNEADEDPDGSPDGDPDGDPEDDAVEDDQDVDEDGDIQDEEPEADPDGNEADEDPDGSPDGDPDGDPEDDAVEDDQDVDDDGDIQDEEPEADPDGNEADGDPDGSPDGDPDGDPEDDTIEDDLDADEDFDDEEDSGELEDYSDDSDDSENNADSNDEADDEAERDQEEEELAEEKANEEAAEEAEDAVSEDANKLADDEADPVEDENQKLLESQPEDSAENNESGDESNENEHMDDTPEEENEPEEDIDSESEDDLTDELEGSEEYQDEGEPEKYDDEKPVDPVSDTKDDREAPSETDADDKVSKTTEDSEKEDAYRTAMNNMADYLNSHNYGREDYAEYSKDPEWQKLNADLQRSLGMEVTTDVPETSTPSPERGKDVSSTELPDNCVVVNASDIDMTYAQGMDSDQFWNHHGNTKEDYMRVAEKLPDVQQALDSGKSIDELKNDPELGDTVRAYYDPDNMIKVEQQPDGSYSFTDDGRHRIAAAQECGYQIPVEVTNMPENNASPVMEKQADGEAQPVETKSDISSETKENLGAFEQSKWDNLSQVEKEQAVEKLRDSIAEDLQLENKPNIAYYNKEDPGDYGGYAASTNTIYINRFNMGDSKETADTIAHESRHCWQHERAENPQTEQDQQFKENFEDYTKPEENFEEYLDQPVEKDAREYAEQIKNQIPESEQENNASPASTSEIGEDEYRQENPRAPPEGEYESKTVTELPSDFESKNEADHYKKLAEASKEAFNGSSGKEVTEGATYKELSSAEKEDLSNKCKEIMNSIPKEDRGNFRVPEPEKIKGVTAEGRIVEAWKPNTDGAVDGSRHMEIPQKGQVIDRIGGENGNYFSPVGENGQPASLKERAIGDYLPEENISDNSSYHAYEIQQDFTKENFQSAIENSDLTPAEKTEMLADLEDYYSDCADPSSNQHQGDVYASNERTADGVKTGTIAPMFQKDDGGATQYITPFSAAQLQKIGMIKEV